MPEVWQARFDEDAVKTVDLEFAAVEEPWAAYDVEGKRVHMKLVVTRMAVLADEGGEPILAEDDEYQFRAEFQIMVRQQSEPSGTGEESSQ